MRTLHSFRGLQLGRNMVNYQQSMIMFVYTNSVVCGGIILHNDSIVGSQSYVDKNVEEGCMLLGVSARLIDKEAKDKNGSNILFI